ncbi:MAG: ribose transport system ATP-binding protein [Pseudonocardiales bacterium]|nr:ribose transport system ATP-binding protein [Pseudonocardiales bacterium]
MTAGLAAPHRPALEIRGARKVYGGTVALADVDLTVREGEIHSLVGENGAGKSTLVRLIAGIEQPDAGSVSFFGSRVEGLLSPDKARRAGAAFIHQDLALIQNLSVTENVALTSGYPRRRGLIQWSAAVKQARAAIATIGADIDPEESIGNLPIAGQAVVAIARALAMDVRLLILDEPTANLPDGEAARLHAVLRRLRERGISSILISHRLDEVLDVSDRISMLRDGHLVAVRQAAETSKAELVRLMLGHEPARLEVVERPVGEDNRLVLDRAAAAGFGPISLHLRAGEVLGLTGLAGSGYLELAEAAFGTRQLTQGTMSLDGSRYAPTSSADAVNQGVGFVPADRNANAALAHMTLRENLFLNPRGRGIIRHADEYRRAREILSDFNVKPSRPDVELATLSGGNAQKVILARCLVRQPRLLLLCEPTAAVDIGTRVDIHERLRAMSARGGSVLVASSDVEELVDVCDRVAILRRGQLIRILDKAELAAHNVRKALHDDPR